jgi:hypothetical protein
MGLQGAALFLLAWAAVLNLAVLEAPIHDYHFIRLVETPPVVNHKPAPVREIPPPQVARVQTPPVEVLRVPPPEMRTKISPEEVPVAPQGADRSQQASVPSSGRAGYSAAVGEDPRFLDRQFSPAHNRSRSEERPDRRIWRPEWRSRA